MEAKFNERFNSVANTVEKKKTLSFEQSNKSDIFSNTAYKQAEKQKREGEQQKANDNVMDIMFQMMYDEKRFGLDKKQEMLYGQDSSDPKNRTRAKLLRQVEEDLKKAR